MLNSHELFITVLRLIIDIKISATSLCLSSVIHLLYSFHHLQVVTSCRFDCIFASSTLILVVATSFVKIRASHNWSVSP